jgi:hypothetical protein
MRGADWHPIMILSIPAYKFRFRLPLCVGLLLILAVAVQPVAHCNAADVPNQNVIDRILREQHCFPDQRPRASHEHLIRRIYLDLTGYPPTLQEQKACSEVASPQQYIRLVDQLLLTRRHSERWGRWLAIQTGVDEQQLTYASGEMQTTRQRLFRAWIDWMTVRVARDQSYDEIVEQCLTATSRDGRKATDYYAELSRLSECSDFRSLNYKDRLSNDLYWRRYSMVYDPQFRAEDVAARFLGINLACARCHDHPFQPLTQENHQRFTELFSAVRYSELPLTDAEKRTLLSFGGLLLILPVGLFLAWAARSGATGHYWHRIPSALIAVISVGVFVALSYQHLLSGFVSDERVTPGMMLAPMNERLNVSAGWGIGILATVHVLLGWVWLRYRKRAPLRSLLATALLPFLTLLMLDLTCVTFGSGYWRLGVLPAMHQQVLHLLGYGGCEQQPREIFVRRQPGELLNAFAPFELAMLEFDRTTDDPRSALMDWLRRPDVPLLAENFVNVAWNEYFGEPLVSDAELLLLAGGIVPEESGKSSELRRKVLGGLASEFRGHDWSMRHLHQVIVTSQLYQLASDPKGEIHNKSDAALGMPAWLTSFPIRRLSAEQLVAGVETALETRQVCDETYCDAGDSPYLVGSDYPWSGTWAAGLLRAFAGSPGNRSFSADAALFSLLDPELQKQIPIFLSGDLWKRQSEPDAALEKLWLRCFCRIPTSAELESIGQLGASWSSEDDFLATVTWSLLNSAEFQYVF